jgi:chemotaxis protein MotB
MNGQSESDNTEALSMPLAEAEQGAEDDQQALVAAPAQADDDEGDAECPPCKGGAPGWMATFADMATLLMAFFVLLLSFSDTEVPKFEQINGSIKAAFGIRKVMPTISIPAARSLVVETFTPAIAQRTVIDEQRQRSDNTTAENLVVRDGPASEDFAAEEELRRVESALAEALNAGDVTVRLEDNDIVVEVNAEAYETASTGSPGESTAGQVSKVMVELASQISAAQTQITRELQVYMGAPSASSNTNSEQTTDSAADSPEQRLQRVRADLNTQVEQGLLDVELIERGVLIRLSSQDSFVSGSADLQTGFLDVLREVAQTLAAEGGPVIIEGHTDNIPVVFSDRFNSNWDLSALRAASVAEFLSETAQIEAQRLRVIGLADTVPLDSNSSDSGRARNRRIEIILVNGS